MQKNEKHEQLHREFAASGRRHVLMITNHGYHAWDMVLGLPDTGGQNMYVNELCSQLTAQGYRVTVVNRGGFAHPQTGVMRKGLHYRDQHSRLLYLEDGRAEFVRKEDMADQLPALAKFYMAHQQGEQIPCDLIISNYWDAAALGILINRALPKKVRHIWIPHSVGTVKKRNMPPDAWPRLRIDERIAAEQEIVKELDGVAATSTVIREALCNDYKVAQPLFLPPGVDIERFYPREVKPDSDLWAFLGKCSTRPPAEIARCKIVCEISRTDHTKRKDVLVKAFAAIHEKIPDAFLIVALAEEQKDIYDQVQALIDESGIRDKTAVIGWAGDVLHLLYAASDVYCTPSVMEGFGMAAQEACACGVPVVASNLVPFVVEYLLGDKPEVVEIDDHGRATQIRVGTGGVVVPADDVAGFAGALELLLKDDNRRRTMGAAAHRITVPDFAWEGLVRKFLAAMGENV